MKMRLLQSILITNLIIVFILSDIKGKVMLAPSGVSEILETIISRKLRHTHPDQGDQIFDLRVSPGSYNDPSRTNRIIEYLKEQNIDLEGKRVLIPGAGAGKLPIFAANRGAFVVAIEIQKTTCDDMMFNVNHAGLADMIDVRQGHYLLQLNKSEKFDIILCHPPIFGNNDAKSNVSVNDPHFSFIVGVVNILTEHLNEQGRIILLYPSEATALNLVCPEENIYFFNIIQQRGNLKERGFHIFDALPYQNEESTIWEIIHYDNRKTQLPRSKPIGSLKINKVHLMSC